MVSIDVQGVVHGNVLTAPKQTEAVHMSKIAHKARSPPKGLVIDMTGHIDGYPSIAVSPKHAGVECKKKLHQNRFKFEPCLRTLSVGNDGIVHETAHNDVVCADSAGHIHTADVMMCPKSPAHLARMKDAHKRRFSSASEIMYCKLDGTVEVMDTSTPAMDSNGVVQGKGEIQPMSPARSYALNSRMKAVHRHNKSPASSPIFAVDKRGLAYAPEPLWDFWLPSNEVSCC